MAHASDDDIRVCAGAVSRWPTHPGAGITQAVPVLTVIKTTNRCYHLLDCSTHMHCVMHLVIKSRGMVALTGLIISLQWHNMVCLQLGKEGGRWSHSTHDRVRSRPPQTSSPPIVAEPHFIVLIQAGLCYNAECRL